MESVRNKIRKIYPEIWFWGVVVLLNFLFFVPIYLFYEYRTQFFPSFETPKPTTAIIFNTFFVERSNLDIFRFQFEWLMVTVLWIWFRPIRQKWVLNLIYVLFWVQLVYMIYEGFIRSFYLLEPTFFNDYFLFSDLTQYVIKNLNLPFYVYIGAPVLLVALFYLFYKLFVMTFMNERLAVYSGYSKFAALGITAVLFYATFSPAVVEHDLGQPISSVSSFVVKVTDNITLSRQSKVMANRFDKQQIAQAYNYSGLLLDDRPDVYIIFVESYGSVLYQRPDFSLSTVAVLNRLNSTLTDDGWHVASNRSDAPTWGGGSWISYTSALSGIRIETHSEYLSLLNQYHNESFPHLVNYFRSQGYTSYRVSSISRELDDLQLERYKEFYGFDEWLRFGEIEYDGPLYGWGPSPPDQYSLNFAHQYMNEQTGPHVLFYISQNSHYPWYPLPEVVDDWQSLNDAHVQIPRTTQTFSQEELRHNYMRSIEYEMSMLVDFIVKEGDANDIFVLVGDHQPARVARRADGFDTPIHIVSQNEQFVQSFLEDGFVPQLVTRDVEPNMHHEGFYSLFMQEFLASYGKADQEGAPIYAPAGLTFSTVP